MFWYIVKILGCPHLTSAMIGDFYDVWELGLSSHISVDKVTISISHKTKGYQNYILIACVLQISKRLIGTNYLLNYNTW